MLESLYSSMRVCQSNDDCAYLNEAFEPIPHQTIPFGSCSALVANRAVALQSRETLISARDRVNQSCGGQLELARCKGSRRFMSHSPAPLCRKQTCMVPSDREL